MLGSRVHHPLTADSNVRVSDLRLHIVLQNSITSHSLNHAHRSICCLCLWDISLFFGYEIIPGFQVIVLLLVMPG